MKSFTERQLDGSALRKRLAHNEELSEEQATGDNFYHMLQDIGNASKVPNPYSFEEGELGKRVETIEAEFSSLRHKIKQLWQTELPKSVASAPRFTFSAILKHTSIALSDSNSRATGGGIYSTALIEPPLPMNTPCKISFMINKHIWILLGVCYRKETEKRSFDYGCN